MAIYSFSKINLYKQCPLKYRYKYIDKIELQEFEETADLLLWKAVHFALEKFYNDLNNFHKPSKTTLVKFFDDYFESKISEQKEKWNEIVIKWDNKIEDYKRRWVIYLEQYRDKHSPFEDIKVVSTETNIVFELDENIKFRGVVDRLDKKWNTFVINDYKTNKNLPTEDKDDYIEQLTLYWLWIKQKYGKYMEKMEANLYFLHFDIEDRRIITDKKLDEIVKKYKSIIQEIEQKTFDYNMWDKKSFETRENPLCRFCEYQTACPLFSHSNMDDEVVVWEKTIKKLVDQYWDISNQLSDLDKQKKMIKEVILNYLEDKEYKKLYWKDYLVSISESKNYKIENKEKFIEILEKEWILNDTMDIDRHKVNKLFKDKELDINELKEIIKPQTSWTLRAGKNK